jgi:hypothetical protein
MLDFFDDALFHVLGFPGALRPPPIPLSFDAELDEVGDAFSVDFLVGAGPVPERGTGVSCWAVW